MLLREDPGLKGRAGGKGVESNKAVGFPEQAGANAQALPNNVTVDTGPVIVKMTRRLLEAVAGVKGNDRGGYELGMGVFK